MSLLWESWLWNAVTFLLAAAALAYYYLTSQYSFWKRLNVPYKEPLLFYGNMKDVLQFKKSQFELFRELYNHFRGLGHRFGGIFQLRQPALLVCDPELARDIYIKNFPHFHDRAFIHDEHFDPLSAHLVALDGQKWKFIRSKLSPVFSAAKLRGMVPLIRDQAEAYMRTLGGAEERGEAVEMRKSFLLYMTDMIGAVAFGLEVNAQKHQDSEFFHMGASIFEPTKWQRVLQIFLQTYPWVYKMFRIQLVPKDVTEFFMGVLRETMEHRRKTNTQKNDFLHFLMKIKEEKGSNLKEMDEMKGVDGYNMSVNENSIELTEGVIAAQAFVFFLAGYETSASAMSACAHTLAYHPDIQQKMYEEVETVTRKFGEINYEAIQSLTFIEQVIEETLRMYPPVGLNVRKCTREYPLPGTSTVIPKGCQVFIPIYSFHYDPEYFPEPEVFKPERFSPENRGKLVPYAFMPFGHGPRVCIGQRLAMLEMKLTMALLVKNFEIVKSEKTTPFKISPQSFFMNPVDGLWVRFLKRKKT